MIECLHCGRLFPEVVGAPTQVCPHCGHETGESKRSAAKISTALPVDPVSALTTAMRVAAREYPRLLVLYLPVLLLGIGVEWYVDSAETASEMTDGERMQFLGVGLPLVLLFLSLRLALWTFVAARTLDVLTGSGRLRDWRRLLGPALVMGFVLALVFLTGALVIVGFFVFLHWFMYAPAQLAAGAPTIGAAFDRSRRFARDRRTIGFTTLVVLIGTAVIVPYLLADALPGPLGFVLPALIAWAGGPIVPLLAASYVAIAMQEGTKERASVRSTPAARATTKCPRCSTLIPYARTEGPTDVVCPACGYAGKVL